VGKKAKGVRGGAYDTYVKFGDIKGESTDDKNKYMIEMMRYIPRG